MPVLGKVFPAALSCVLLPLLLTGCPLATPQCPEATVTFDPPVIPPGVSETTVIVDVTDPRPELGLEVITELSSVGGAIADPFARETTFACAFDASGPVEVCATATYVGGDGDAGVPDGGVPEGGMPEAGVSTVPQSEGPNIGASYQYLGKPHIVLSSPVQCSETRCTTINCPEDKNECPEVSSLTVEPMDAREGGTATIRVVADDPDKNPEALVTTITAANGTVTDPNANETTYTCDPAVGGFIEICVVASDGDSSCDAQRCTTVQCPGVPLENTCPVIEDFTATPMAIPENESTTAVRVDVADPDEFPQPLIIELSSPTGVFDDRFATETTFTCGKLGPVELRVDVSDGDEACDKTRSITVQCPSTIPDNFCLDLFNINFIGSTIRPGENDRFKVCSDATDGFALCNQDADCPGGTCNEPCPGERCAGVQTRARDVDHQPLPVTLTLRAPWGSFENTETLQCQGQGCDAPYFQNAIYICDRPGEVEICVDATDGACQKTQCDEVECPDDIPPP
jgi:hypothetical protein